MTDRFFSATALGGRFYLDGFGDQPHLEDERVVAVFVPRLLHRRIDSAEALLKVLAESERGLPAIRIWICSDLVDEARCIWEDRGHR